MKILSDRMLRIKGSAGHSRCTDLHALLKSFEYRVLHIEPINTAVQRCAINSRSTGFASR